LNELPPEMPPPPRSPREALERVLIKAPSRGNRKLEALFDAANGDEQLKAWWYMAQVNANRLGMTDHSWIHIQIVVNIALRLFRLLRRKGLEPVMVSEHGMGLQDAEVVITAGCLLHDTGMSIHRNEHEAYSLFLAGDKLEDLLAGIYEEPERSVVAAEVLHAIIGHRRHGQPLTLEAGIVRVADALDMAEGRSRFAFESGRQNIHSLSAAAIDKVRIEGGEDKAVRIEIAMNNSAGIFQVDELLAMKLRGSGLEEHLEVIASIEADTEKRLLTLFRI
jgi:metal-dependent HD superfamily phosphatase/phosphodiesterase